MTYEWRQRCWLVIAPSGQWSSGPIVIYDMEGDTQDILHRYTEQGYTVDGPYVLEK